MFNSFTFVLSYTDFLFQKFRLLRATAKLGAQCPLGTPGGSRLSPFPGNSRCPVSPGSPGLCRAVLAQVGSVLLQVGSAAALGRH